MLYAHIWLYTGVGHCIVYSDLGFTTTFYLVSEINLTLSLFIITAHSRLVGKPKTYSIMVSFQTALENFFKKGFTFSGRATRAEYWWWALFQFQISIDIMFFGSLLANLFVGVGRIFPFLSFSLFDINKNRDQVKAISAELKEIAKMLGITYANALKIDYRAKERLKELCGEAEIEW